MIVLLSLNPTYSKIGMIYLSVLVPDKTDIDSNSVKLVSTMGCDLLFKYTADPNQTILKFPTDLLLF